MSLIRQRDVIRIDFDTEEVAGDEVLEELDKAIRQIIRELDPPKILINFAGVDFITAAAVTSLVQAKQDIVAHEGQIRMANVGPSIREILKVTRALRQIPQHNDLEEAMAAFE